MHGIQNRCRGRGMTKRVKYICRVCGDGDDACILEVGEDACTPYRCPWNETDYPEWELMNEADEHD